MDPGGRPDGPVEASGRPGCVSGNSGEDLRDHREHLPWLEREREESGRRREERKKEESDCGMSKSVQSLDK
jgi:hypothetical protein